MIRTGALRARLADERPEALARAAAGGDDEAFAALVRRFQRRLLGFAYQHLRDPYEAQDLAQEIFVRVHRGLAGYDAARPFEPWFWRVAANVSANYARRLRPTAGEPPIELAAPDAPDSELAEALGALDAGVRLPLLLHYYSGLSLDEVALAIGITVPALKSRMHRGRSLLRQSLVDAE